MNRKEIWSNVKGYIGRYQVSNYGRVRTLTRRVKLVDRWGNTIRRLIKGKVMKNKKKSSETYPMVTFYKNSIQKDFYIHRLVAQTFIPNPENLPQVNHKDGIRSNNKVKNLEWCNSSYNALHWWHILGKGPIKFNKRFITNVQNDFADGTTNDELKKKYKINKEQLSRIKRLNKEIR